MTTLNYKLHTICYLQRSERKHVHRDITKHTSKLYCQYIAHFAQTLKTGKNNNERVSTDIRIADID